MAIQFTIAKRKSLPAEGEEKWTLCPRLYSRQTIDAVEFQRKAPWGTLLSYDALGYALGEARRIMLHEMADGKAVTLPGIGTFRLSLKGEIEIQNGVMHGRDVHVDGIIFQPDREFCDKVRRMKVMQEPMGFAVSSDAVDVDEVLTELFARTPVVAHKHVFFAFEATLTHHRVSSLLSRLVREGRLIKEGSGARTQYRAVPGNFGA